MKRIIASLAVVCMLTTLTNTKVVFADLSDGLVAYYPFNGSANDESGNGNNGTVNGATLTTDRFGNTNKAYSFDGVDDYIELGNPPQLQITGNLTLEAWFKIENPGNYKQLIAKWWSGNTPSEAAYNLGWSNSGLGFSLQNSSNVMLSVYAGTSYSNGNWHHAAGTWDGTNIKLYVDGILIASEANPSFGYIANITRTARIGTDTRYTHGTGDRHFKGLIDEIHIYNRALSESEIQELYNEGSSTTPTATPIATLVQTPTPTPTVTATVTPTPTPSETGIVFGYVYDEDENPLRSVTVKIDGDDYSDSDTTDEDGYYAFDKVPAGDYTITYTKTGYVTQTMEVTVEEGDAVQAESVTMLVVQKGSIYGYVVDIKGNPIESVRLTFNGIGIKVKKTASTDSDGFFEFKDLEAGIYRIVAKKRFYKAAQQTVELEEGEDKEIEIEMKKTTKRIMMEGVQD